MTIIGGIVLLQFFLQITYGAKCLDHMNSLVQQLNVLNFFWLL